MGRGPPGGAFPAELRPVRGDPRPAVLRRAGAASAQLRDKAQSAEGPGPSSGDSLPPHAHPQPRTLLQVKPCPTSLGGRSLPPLEERVSGRPRGLGPGCPRRLRAAFLCPSWPHHPPLQEAGQARQPPPHQTPRGQGHQAKGRPRTLCSPPSRPASPPRRPGTGLGGGTQATHHSPAEQRWSWGGRPTPAHPSPVQSTPHQRSPTPLGGAPAPGSGRKDGGEACGEHGEGHAQRAAWLQVRPSIPHL